MSKMIVEPKVPKVPIDKEVQARQEAAYRKLVDCVNWDENRRHRKGAK